jgi:hypothetical protein
LSGTGVWADMMPRARRLGMARWLAWVALLVSIPVTSFPGFPPLPGFGDTLVRPLGLYPLAFLVLADLIPAMARGYRPPRILGPILGFAVAAAAITLLSLLNPTEPLRDQVPLLRAARGLGTLAIGLAFLLVTVRMSSTRERLVSSLRWLLGGMAAASVWGLLQASRLVFRWPYYAPLNAIQRLISVRDMNEYRVSGLSYEPSWFADQLAVLALPLLLSSLLTGARLFGRSRAGWAAELTLSGAAIVGLVLSYSRGGVLAFLASSAVCLAATAASRGRGDSRRAATNAVRQGLRGRTGRSLARAALLIVVILGMTAIVVSSVSRYEYFTLLWTRLPKLGDPAAYFSSLGAGTRYSLAVASWDIFADHPWIGVGLGQSGFYILDYLPDWATDRNPEMTFLISSLSWHFPNPKNLWFRLLAETGIAGSLLFAIFLLLAGLGTLTLLRRREPLERFMGVFGCTSLVAILFSGTSLDTFALPTMWIALGIIVSGVATVLDSDAASAGPATGNPPPDRIQRRAY